MSDEEGRLVWVGAGWDALRRLETMYLDGAGRVGGFHVEMYHQRGYGIRRLTY